MENDKYNQMKPLINELISQGYLKTERIIHAMRKINRADFMLPEFKNSAEANVPLPIGFGQTISQPLTVAFMLELLQPKPGDKILDVGSGSGWTTALLSEIVGKKGKVIGLEIVPELCKFGEENVRKYFPTSGVGSMLNIEPKNSNGSGLNPEPTSRSKSKRVQFLCVDGSKGYSKEAPYDKILVSAAAEKLPVQLKKQIKVGGRIVIPVRSSIWLIERVGKNKFREE